MEREEAIKICKELRKYLCEGNPAWKFNAVWNTEKVHEALTTAIIDMEMMPRMLERLGKVNLSKCDLIDRTALMDRLKPQWNIQDDDEFANKTIWRELTDAPTVTLEDISNAYENGYAQGKFEAQEKNESKRYGRTGYRLNGEDMKKCKDCEYSWQLTEKVYICTNDVYDITNKSCYVENTVCGSQQSHCESDSTTALNSAFDSESRVL